MGGAPDFFSASSTSADASLSLHHWEVSVLPSNFCVPARSNWESSVRRHFSCMLSLCARMAPEHGSIADVSSIFLRVRPQA
ncbi:hypothetical protein V6N13_082672 [Hibiscus sabdariffa]